MAFSFKIKPNQFIKLEGKLKKDVADILSSEALKTAIGEFAVERLKYQTRLGKPLNAGDSLPDLKDSTKRTRAYLAKYNSTHPTFAVARSNLTITGALMDSLSFLDTGDFKLKISFKGDHPRYKSRNGYFGKVISNETLAGYLSDKGFKVFDQTLSQKKQFINRISNIARQFIRRALRVRSRLSS
jgi:hypothetical protein